MGIGFGLGDGEGDPPPEPEPPGEVDPPEPPAVVEPPPVGPLVPFEPDTEELVEPDPVLEPEPDVLELVELFPELSFCCANGSRAVPVSLECTVAVETLTAGRAVGLGAVLDGNGICASALLPGDLERKTGIATSAARRATATGHSRFSRSSLMMSLKKLISPRRSRRPSAPGWTRPALRPIASTSCPTGPTARRR